MEMAATPGRSGPARPEKIEMDCLQMVAGLNGLIMLGFAAQDFLNYQL
jgi:hypothetical protein